MAKTIYLHIGTHKTGTTALQRTLYKHDKLLMKAGFRFYSGLIIPSNHQELSFAAMRADRGRQASRAAKGLVPNSEFSRHVYNHIRSFIAVCPNDRLIFSHEGLSYLRHPDEIAFLQSLFEGCDVKVIVYLREPNSFLESFRKMLVRRGVPLSHDPTSLIYVEKGSWLIDYEALLAAYRGGFGVESVIVRDYDLDNAASGGTIGSFLTLLGFAPAQREAFGEVRVGVSAKHDPNRPARADLLQAQKSRRAERARAGE